MTPRRGSNGSLLPGAALATMVAGALAMVGAPAVDGAFAPEIRARFPEVRSHEEGPPAGHTGGFGEPTCHACHLEYEVNGADGLLTLEGWPKTYRAGESYTLTVSLQAEGMPRAGFQLAVRTSQGGLQAGTLVPIDGLVVVRDSAGVSYAQQTRDGSRVADGRSASWVLSWTAPDGAGPVQVDLAANSANGDNSPFGDLIFQRTWSAAPESER